MESIISVSGLTKTFPVSRRQRRQDKTASKRKTAVNGLTFEAFEGEVFGLLGPNGAGKTTTLRMLATLLKPDSGEILVDGVRTAEKPNEVRRRIAFMTGEMRLEEFFTPSYLFDFFSNLRSVPPEIMKARKAELFERFGVSAFAHERMASLSTGMKQKVSLLVSMVHDPNIIIFDEPTNGLDVLTARVVTDFLLELKAQGKSIIVSTHIFSLIEKICDRAGIIVGGRMAACGPLEAMTADKCLEDLFFEIHDRECGMTEGGRQS